VHKGRHEAVRRKPDKQYLIYGYLERISTNYFILWKLDRTKASSDNRSSIPLPL
jgi:hypothetical protein